MAREDANAPEVRSRAAAATTLAAYRAGHRLSPELAQRAGLRTIARLAVDESMSALSAAGLEAARHELGDGPANRLEQRVQAALRETNSATREQLLSAAFYGLRRDLNRRLPEGALIGKEFEESRAAFIAAGERLNRHLAERKRGAAVLAEAALQFKAGRASEEQRRAWLARIPRSALSSLDRLWNECNRREPGRCPPAVAAAEREALEFETAFLLFEEVDAALVEGPPANERRAAWLARATGPGDRAALEGLLDAAAAFSDRQESLGARLEGFRAEHGASVRFLDGLDRVDQIRAAAVRAGANGEGVVTRIELDGGETVEGVSRPLVFQRPGGPFAVPPAFERYLAGLSGDVEMQDRYELAGVHLRTAAGEEFFSADGRVRIVTMSADGRSQKVFSMSKSNDQGDTVWIPVGTIIEDLSGQTPPLSIARVDDRETLTEARILADAGARTLIVEFGVNEARLPDDQRSQRIATAADELSEELGLEAGLTESLTHMLRHRVRMADRYGYSISVSAVKDADGRHTITITEGRGAGRKVYELRSPRPDPSGRRRTGTYWAGAIFEVLPGQPPISRGPISYENAYTGDPSRPSYDRRYHHGPLVREPRTRIEEEGNKIWEMFGSDAYELDQAGAPTHRRDLSRDDRGEVIADTSVAYPMAAQSLTELVQPALMIMEAAGRGAVGVAYVVGGAGAGLLEGDMSVTRRAAADAMLMWSGSGLARAVYGEEIVSETYSGFNARTRALMDRRGAVAGTSGYAAWRDTATPQERLLALSENQNYGMGARRGLMLLAVGVTIGQGLVESAPLMVAGPATNLLLRGGGRGLRMAGYARAGAVVRAGAGRTGAWVGRGTWAYDQVDDFQTTLSLPDLAGKMWTSGSMRDIHDFLVAASDSHISDGVGLARDVANPSRLDRPGAPSAPARVAAAPAVAPATTGAAVPSARGKSGSLLGRIRDRFRGRPAPAPAAAPAPIDAEITTLVARRQSRAPKSIDSVIEAEFRSRARRLSVPSVRALPAADRARIAASGEVALAREEYVQAVRHPERDAARRLITDADISRAVEAKAMERTAGVSAIQRGQTCTLHALANHLGAMGKAMDVARITELLEAHPSFGPAAVARFRAQGLTNSELLAAFKVAAMEAGVGLKTIPPAELFRTIAAEGRGALVSFRADESGSHMVYVEGLVVPAGENMSTYVSFIDSNSGGRMFMEAVVFSRLMNGGGVMADPARPDTGVYERWRREVARFAETASPAPTPAAAATASVAPAAAGAAGPAPTTGLPRAFEPPADSPARRADMERGIRIVGLPGVTPALAVPRARQAMGLVDRYIRQAYAGRPDLVAQMLGRLGEIELAIGSAGNSSGAGNTVTLSRGDWQASLRDTASALAHEFSHTLGFDEVGAHAFQADFLRFTGESLQQAGLDGDLAPAGVMSRLRSQLDGFSRRGRREGAGQEVVRAFEKGGLVEYLEKQEYAAERLGVRTAADAARLRREFERSGAARGVRAMALLEEVLGRYERAASGAPAAPARDQGRTGAALPARPDPSNPRGEARAVAIDDAAAARKDFEEGRLLMIRRLMEVTIEEDPQAARELSHLLGIPARNPRSPVKIRFESAPNEIGENAAVYQPKTNEIILSLDGLMSPTLQTAEILSHERQHAYDFLVNGNLVEIASLQTETRAFEAMAVMRAALRRRAERFGVAPGGHSGGERLSEADAKRAQWMDSMERRFVEKGGQGIRDYLQSSGAYGTNEDAAALADQIELRSEALDRLAAGKATPADRAMIAASRNAFILELSGKDQARTAATMADIDRRFANALWVEGRPELAVKPDNPLFERMFESIRKALLGE